MSDIKVKVSSDTSQFQRGISQMERSLNGLKNITAAIGAGMAFSAASNMLGRAVSFSTDLLKNSIKTAMEFETMGIQMRVLVGDAQKAENLLSNIREYAAKTPLQLGDLNDAAKTLLSFGITSEKIIPVLQRLGDVSMGDADKLSRMARVFGQVSSAGRLQLEDVNQLIDAGFSPLEEISQRTGKSVEELRDAISDGALDITDLAQAFEFAAGKGGKFYDMLGTISRESFAGKLSNLKDAFTQLQAEFGKGVIKELSPLLGEGAIPLVESLKGTATDLGKMAGTLIANLRTEIMPIITNLTEAAKGGKFFSGLKDNLTTILTDVVTKVISDPRTKAALETLLQGIGIIAGGKLALEAGQSTLARIGGNLLTGAAGGGTIYGLTSWLKRKAVGTVASSQVAEFNVAMEGVKKTPGIFAKIGQSGVGKFLGRFGGPAAAITTGATIGEYIGSFLRNREAEAGFERAKLYGAKSNEEIIKQFGSPAALVAGKSAAQKTAEAIKAAEDIFLPLKKTAEVVKSDFNLTDFFKPKDKYKQFQSKKAGFWEQFAPKWLLDENVKAPWEIEKPEPTGMTKAITRSLARVGGGGDIFTGGPVNLQREGNKILTRIERNTRNATIGVFG